MPVNSAPPPIATKSGAAFPKGRKGAKSPERAMKKNKRGKEMVKRQDTSDKDKKKSKSKAKGGSKIKNRK